MTVTKYDVDCNMPDIYLAETKVEDQGLIPDALTKLTYMVIALHQANGDLAWLADMVRDAEFNPESVKSEIDIEKYKP